MRCGGEILSPTMEPVRVSEARVAIAELITAQILEGFRRDRDELAEHDEPGRRARSTAAAHDPSRVPAVPTATVVTRQVGPGQSTGVVFTWKVEYGDAPYFVMDVATTWPRRIAAPGWAVLAGRPVVDVLDWDQQRRPVRIKSCRLESFFDASLHGWRSWAVNAEFTVDWSDPDRPVLHPEPAPVGRIA